VSKTSPDSFPLAVISKAGKRLSFFYTEAK
jgi:hypothetical protein